MTIWMMTPMTSEEMKFSRGERNMTVRMKIIQGMIIIVSPFAYANTAVWPALK